MTQSMEHILKEGTHIGVYEIKDVTRTEAYGITYRAWNEHLNSLVAIMEYFPTDLAIRNEGDTAVKPKAKTSTEGYQYGLQQFIKQAEILEEIKHQSIVGVHNVLQFNETAYLVMDLVDGASLSKWKDLSTSFTEDELAVLLRSLLSALQILHENGSVHGDIHPSNILVRKNGVPVLVNFSAARMALAVHNNHLQEVLHTGYAPPELYEPDNLPAHSTDLYALGATLFRCISQIDPPPSLERQKALNSQQPDPLQIKLDASAPAFNEVLLKCISWMLEPNVSERPQSALEVLTMLDNNFEEAADTKTDSDLKIKGNEAETDQSRTGLLYGSIICIVILLAAGFWYFQRDTRPEAVVLNTDKQTAAVMQEEILEEVSEPAPEETTQIAKLGDQLPSNQQTPTQTTPPDTDKTEPVPGTPINEEVSVEIEADEAPQLSDDTKTVKPTERGTSSTIEDNREELIKQYLIIAEEHIEALRLSTPPDNNAYQQYQAVLEMDPENKDAQEGLQNIVDLYVWFIKSEIQKENYKTAHTYLVRAEKVLPDDPELQRLRLVLNTKEY